MIPLQFIYNYIYFISSIRFYSNKQKFMKKFDSD